jgi:hypothetical protein
MLTQGDVVLPNRGADAKMGGRVLLKRLSELARTTTELAGVIKAELLSALSSHAVSVTGLVVPDAKRHLSSLAGNLGVVFRDEVTDAAVVRSSSWSLTGARGVAKTMSLDSLPPSKR